VQFPACIVHRGDAGGVVDQQSGWRHKKFFSSV
jgi:hypothetical protein